MALVWSLVVEFAVSPANSNKTPQPIDRRVLVGEIRNGVEAGLEEEEWEEANKDEIEVDWMGIDIY